jgi:hypothetical protein
MQFFKVAIGIPQSPVSWLKETGITSKTTMLQMFVYSTIMK